MLLNERTKNKVILLALLLGTFTSQSTSKIIVTSVPKSGTHLTSFCINAIIGKNYNHHAYKWLTLSKADAKSDYIMGHAVYTPHNIDLIESSGFKGVLVLRDPRDQAVSMVRYAKSRPKDWPKLAAMEFNEALTAWILDTSNVFSTYAHMWNDPVGQSLGDINDLFRRFTPWANHPSFYTTTFEKLVGPDGGGSREVQLQEIMNIAQHIDHPISRERAEEIAAGLFGFGETFRTGQIGGYKKYFTEEHKALFKEKAGQLLIDLGYEKNFDW